MNNKKIKIYSKRVCGIANQIFILEGKSRIEDYDFKVVADGEEIPFELEKIKKRFVLSAKLEKKQKKIIVILIDEDGETILCKERNVIIKLIFERIFSKIKRIFKVIGAIFKILFKGLRFLWKEYHFLVPPKMLKKYFKDFIFKIKLNVQDLFYSPFDVIGYNKWLLDNEKEEPVEKLKYNPLISILIPVYNIGREYLSECLDSILNQTYENFEICLVDDCSTKEETKETLEEYVKKDKRVRVKYRKENGHISRTTNDALAMAKGEFVGLVDNDDTLAPNALYEVVKVLNDDKKIDMIYSDEDKLDLRGRRCTPNFKSDFAPDTLLSSNYICHFTVLRKSIVDKIGGERVGYEGAQDYDLFLRFTEKTNRIYHIPKILYHWRMVEGSTSMETDNKGYALERGRLALEDALKRRKIKGKVKIAEGCPFYYIEYDVVDNPKVSIIIPTRNYADITKTCIDSIYEKTTYKNFEVVLVNNNSDEQSLFDLIEKYKKEHKNFKVVDANFEFNYSKINNLAVSKTNSDYVLLLNNDTEVITPNWLELLIGYASQKHIGAVGAKLIYPDETIQHAGVVLGLGGVASHANIGDRRDAIVWGGRTSVPYNYSGVTAACLMISRDKYNEVGGLTEELSVAYNDVDFNIKLLEKGYYNVEVPMVELYHYESKSRGLDTTSEKYNRFLQETDYMWKHWEKYLKDDKFYNPNFSRKRWFTLDK